MEKIFVDSDFLIDFLRGKAYTRSFIDKIESREIEGYISVVTAFELYNGSFLSSNPNKKLNEVENILNCFVIVNIDREMMLKASKINSELILKGEKIQIEDVLIAATAISLNLRLLTNNKKHFNKIKDLRLY